MPPAAVWVACWTILASPLAAATLGSGEDYRRALDAYARGEVETAVEEIVGLLSEAEVHTLVSSAAPPRVVRRLGRRSPEALPPLALLHRRVLLAFSGNGASTLAGAASRQSEAIVQIYVRAGGDRRLAAALLTSLAGEWHARSQESVAEPLYRRALGLDAEQVAALVGLAVIEEKRGSLRAAASLLETAEPLAPSDRELRLRLALVRLRTGREAAALATLGELAAQGGGDWIEALAHQERARWLASTGRLPEALAVARAGSSAVPCDPVLPVLAAYYGERTGDPSVSPTSSTSSVSLEQRLTACDDERRVSARRLYNRQPRRLLELMQGRLEEIERERLPVVAAALGEGGAE